MRSDTASVTIKAAPQKVWNYISDINNWPNFSDFARNIEPEGKNWVVHTSQGDVLLEPRFNKRLLLLDSYCTLASGQRVFIPYRVVPNEKGSELIMTNFQAPGDSNEAYAEQIEWMKKELIAVKKILESK